MSKFQFQLSKFLVSKLRSIAIHNDATSKNVVKETDWMLPSFGISSRLSNLRSFSTLQYICYLWSIDPGRIFIELRKNFNCFRALEELDWCWIWIGILKIEMNLKNVENSVTYIFLLHHPLHGWKCIQKFRDVLVYDLCANIFTALYYNTFIL